MMRRRQPPEPSIEPIPDRLRHFVAEDWVTPGEVPPHMPTTINGHPPTAADIAEVREMLAWGPLPPRPALVAVRAPGRGHHHERTSVTDPGSDWFRELVARKRGRPVEEPKPEPDTEKETDQ